MKGTDIVGTFNSEGRDDVELIKSKAAELIDLIHEHGQNGRHNSIATTHIENAALFGVKCVFTTEEE